MFSKAVKVVSALVLFGIAYFFLSTKKITESSSHDSTTSQHNSRDYIDDKSLDSKKIIAINTEPEDVCLSVEHLSFSTLKVQKQNALRQFFKAFDASGYNKVHRDIVSYHGGLTIQTGREAAEGFSAFPDNELHSIENFSNELSAQEQKVALATLLDKDYGYLIDSMNKASFSVNKSFIGSSLLGMIIGNDNEISLQIIRQFIEVGVKPVFNDLVEATKADVAVEIVQYLHQHSKIDTLRVWRQNYQFESLASLAIKSLNVQLTEYWVAQGSPVSPETPLTTAMDNMPAPENDDQQIQAENIFIILANLGVQPSSVLSSNLLRSWLPSSLIVQYKQQLQPMSIAINEPLEPWIESIRQVIAHFAEKKSLVSACKDQSLSKTVIDNTIAHIDITKPIVKPFQETRERILSQTLKQNWAAASSLATNLAYNNGDSDILSELLAIYIYNNAPFQYIEPLLLQNIPLPKDAIIALASTNNVSLMNKLLAHDLDIYYQENSGNNGITQSISSDSKAIFDYLLTQGVSKSTSVRGKDALIIAIESLGMASKAIYYCHQLVANNINVTTQHISAANKVRDAWPKIYQLLVQKVPELQE